MKRLMCLGLLLCLGVGIFAAQGFAGNDAVLFNLYAGTAPSGDPLGTAAANKGSLTNGVTIVSASGGTAIVDAVNLGVADQVSISIGSSQGNDGTVESAFDMKDLGVVTDNNVWANLHIGGIANAGNLAVLSPFAVPGQSFSVKFGTVQSQKTTGGANPANVGLSVVSGGDAVWTGIRNLIGLKANILGTGSTSEGNTLVLDRFELTATGASLSAVAGSQNATLELSELVRTSTAGNTVGFNVESSSAGTGKLIFTNDVALGGQSGNKDTVTFTSGTGTADTAAVLEARGNLTLKNLSDTTSSDGFLALTASGANKGLITVAENLTLGLADADATLKNVDVAVDGSATIKSDAAAGTAVGVELGNTFTANGVTINGSSAAAGVLTVTVDESLKSGLATLDDPATADVDEAAFTANTITLNGNNSGVVLEGAGAATSKVDASVVRVVGGAAANNNKITSLDVRGELVVGTADTPAYLTVTTSNLRNLTQNRGVTTFSGGAVAVDGMTTISGKDSVNTGAVSVVDGNEFGELVLNVSLADSGGAGYSIRQIKPVGEGNDAGPGKR